MRASTIMRWVTGLGEAFLAIPFLGGLYVISSGYSLLGVMFVLHIITLILAIRDYSAKSGSVVGLVTSAIAWIPVIGWFMHAVSAVLLIIQAVISHPKRHY
ncbi:hypothetical protein [Bhargavaea beijingensis]|uniref:Uncharacterized protein n=1 Tax=Bhargavaea beijingensis TaxID=426756 RepID=A0A1G7G7E5_9BACL|nr:hypothetical protein [Bhargavaea beijingensis]MCW1927417.1 hypothetical protein [Bhargavaea beijingensis]RSK30059.1 hypothetical protein EJA12_10125 [Bhargavaea beijingensis]SDE83959.1 hypothetical protein SAMN04488126_12425 [Bhargavaea beijingensis]